MIVMETHKRLYHAGASYTITELRQMFWIPSNHQQLKKLLCQCVTCNKLTGKPYTAPDPPPLPKVRVKQCKPFTITGVNFTGAHFVRERRGDARKVYICLFTCVSTRAVHNEVVPDLTTESFLLAFRKFSTRKSLQSKMLSDNASTFLAAADELCQSNPTRSKDCYNPRMSPGNSFPNRPRSTVDSGNDSLD